MSASTEITKVEPTDPERTTVEIVPFGSDEHIRLTIAIVQKMIAVPTRSGKQPDPTQCMKFMMLCKTRHLNPFEGDAYLIGYDTQAGPQFSLITAHQVFLKRAEASEGFDGMQSGVIVKTIAGTEEREGDITFEGDELLGGWAKVFRKDRQHPFYRRLKLSTFNTGQSRWGKDPAGMIVKCAEADALRSAFPTHLGGLYITEERPPIEVTATSEPIERPVIEKPKRGRKPKEPETPNLGELLKRVTDAKYTMRDLRVVAEREKWLDEGEEITEEKAAALLENFAVVAEKMDALRGVDESTQTHKDALFA